MNDRLPIKMGKPKKKKSRKQSASDQAKSPRYNEVEKYLNKYGLFLFLIIAIFTSLVVYKEFIFGKFLFLFKDIGSDTINAFYPSFIEVADYLRTEGLPQWSFKSGMGKDIFPFSLGDPFNLILYAMGPKSLAYGIVYIEVLKVVLGGMFFYLFLSTLNLRRYTCIIGGLAYSFSGFMILGGTWYTFSTQAVYLALLLWAFERLYQKKSLYIFPLALALIISKQPFNLYLSGIFILGYAVSRHFYLGRSVKEFIPVVSRTVLLGGLGIIMASVFAYSNFIQMLNSPRGIGGANLAKKLMATKSVLGTGMHNVSVVYRLFSNDLFGSGSFYKGWQNYLESPIFYICLLNLILFTQVFTASNPKQKKVFVSIFVLILLPVIFPQVRFALWLYTGNYYRILSFFIVLTMLIFTLKALNDIIKHKQINLIVLGATASAMLLLLHFPYSKGVPTESIQLKITSLIIIYTIIVALLKYKKIKMFAQIALLALVIYESASFASVTVNNRSRLTKKEFRQRTGFNDYTLDALSYLRDTDKSFYRLNKDYSSGPAVHRSLNDSKVQGYYGTASYESFNHLKYIEFLDAVEALDANVELKTRWSRGLKAKPFLHPFASIKYNLTKNPESFFISSGYWEQIKEFNDVKLLKNRFFLPLGFTYDKMMVRSDFNKLSKWQKDIALLKSFIVDSVAGEYLKKMSKIKHIDSIQQYSWSEFLADINARKEDTLSINHFSNNKVEGTISLNSPKMLFFSIPFDKGWSATINGKSVNLLNINIGFMGIPLGKGDFEIELFYSTPNLHLTTIISIAGIIAYILLIVYLYRINKKLKLEENNNYQHPRL